MVPWHIHTLSNGFLGHRRASRVCYAGDLNRLDWVLNKAYGLWNFAHITLCSIVLGNTLMFRIPRSKI